jgi:hypothetical protein
VQNGGQVWTQLGIHASLVEEIPTALTGTDPQPLVKQKAIGSEENRMHRRGFAG